MLELTSLAVDPAASEQGTWASYLGGRFLIARYNCDKANQMRSQLTLENWDVITGGDEKAAAMAEEIGHRVTAGAILLDWDGVSENGKALKYTPEVGFKYLSDPRFRDLAQFVENYSLNRSNYRERAESEIVESVKDSAAS